MSLKSNPNVIPAPPIKPTSAAADCPKNISLILIVKTIIAAD